MLDLDNVILQYTIKKTKKFLLTCACPNVKPGLHLRLMWHVSAAANGEQHLRMIKKQKKSALVRRSLEISAVFAIFN